MKNYITIVVTIYLLSSLLLLYTSNAIDNGIGRTPPRGWRSFNQFTDNINQTIIEIQYQKLVERTRLVDGVPMSLLDLGYVTAGIDDGWQHCNSGPQGLGFHDENGIPNVNLSRFPNMKRLVQKAKRLGLKPGWYGNNCMCRENNPACNMTTASSSIEINNKCFIGDVKATLEYGFESVKLDGCGVQRNVTEYARLFNNTDVEIMIENCHNHNPYTSVRDNVTGKVNCPMNFFRSSTDIRPTYGSILINLNTTRAYNGNGLTGPGCWAYPDMLEVGVTNSQKGDVGCKTYGQPGCTLNIVETRTHFNAWCIVSSPLVLGNDLNDTVVMDLIWDIISNKEAIAVNEAWAGDSGNLVSQSEKHVHMLNCSWFNPYGCDHPEWMVWAKKLEDGKIAVLLMNNAAVKADVALNFESDLGITTCGKDGKDSCSVRDINLHKNLGNFEDGYIAKQLLPHDSAFLIINVAKKIDVSIYTSTPIAVTSANFLGINIDAASLYQETRLDLNDPMLRKLACKLSKQQHGSNNFNNTNNGGNSGRMTLRIGGSAADDLSTFIDNATHGHIYLTESYWDELIDFANECDFNVAWDLNMRIGRHTNANNSWDPQDALRLLDHMKLKKQNVWAFQLGNEPGHYETRNGGTPTALQHAKDFITFSKILDKYYPIISTKIGEGGNVEEENNRPRMQGPDVCLGDETNTSPCANMTYFETILKSIGPNILSDVTAHTYGLRGPKPGAPPSFSQCHIDDFLNVTTFQSNVVDAVAAWRKGIQNISPNLKLVISETATAADGGCEGLSNRFIAGFYFLQILGELGDIGVWQVYRQNIIGFGGINFGSHYTLLNPPGWYNTKVSGEITPNPDYFTSVLYRKLVGSTRLKVVSDNNKLIHAACAVDGGVVVTFINPTMNSLSLNLNLNDIDMNNICHQYQKDGNNNEDKVELYILTADNLTSSNMKLNGVTLDIDSSLEFLYGDSKDIDIPSFSYGFIVQR